jgi:hypothetical protein
VPFGPSPHQRFGCDCLPMANRRRYGSTFYSSANYIVRCQRPPDPLQLELTDWLDLNGVLNLHQRSWTDEDLTGLGFVAQPACDIGYRADSGVPSKPMVPSVAKPTITPVAIRSTRLLPLPSRRVVPPNLHSVSPA